MAFRVETGAIVAGANSLCSVEYARQYHADRQHDKWFERPDEHEAALIRATDFLCRRYGIRFQGERVTTTQALCWPRRIAVPGLTVLSTEVPTAIQSAVAEIAYREVLGQALDTVVDTRLIKSSKVSVGSISKETTYADGNVKATEQDNRIDELLRPFLRSSVNVRLQRG